MPVYEFQVFLPLLVVRDREHGAVCAEPLRKNDTMPASSALRPIGGISAAEAIHRLLGPGQTQVVGEDLDDQQDNVDIVEKAQVDMVYVERLGIRCRARKGHANPGDVAATEDSKR